MQAKRSKAVVRLVLATALLSAISGESAVAQSKKSSSSFSSRSSSSSSRSVSSSSSSKWGGTSRPSSDAGFSTHSTNQRSSASFKSDAGSASSKFGKQYNSDLDRRYQQQAGKQSYEAYRKTMPAPKPRYFPEADLRKYRNRYTDHGVFRQAGRDQDAWQSRYRYYQSNPPVFGNRGSAAFGLLSGLFLYGLLNDVASAGEFAFHHQNDPDYQQWRAEADRLAQDNADLKAKLAQIDTLKEAKGTGQPDPNWLPPGVPASAVLSDEALKSSQPDFKVCVGSESGPYYKVAQTHMLPVLAEWVNLMPVVTKGTPEILAKIQAGDCDAGFVQGDTPIDDQRFDIIFRPFDEAGHLACSVKLKAKTIDDLGGQTVWIPKNSGSRMTWDHLLALKPDYHAIKVRETVNYEEAIFKAVQTQSCLFYMAAPHAAAIDRLIDRTDLRLLTIDAPELINAGPYQAGRLSSNDYSKTVPKYFFFEGHVQTIVAPASFLMSKAWQTQHADIAAKMALRLTDVEHELKQSLAQ